MVNITNAINTAQMYPVIGAVVSACKGLKFGAKAISHIAQYNFKSLADYFKNVPVGNERNKQKSKHLNLANRCSRVFLLHLVNVVTLGLFYPSFRFEGVRNFVTNFIPPIPA